jgi:outer membrane immunogenic protein
MTFRSALLASAAILSAGSAFAADLPARVAPAPYIAAPMFTWTGFYVGLNAGAAWNNSDGGFGYGGPAFIVAPTVYGAVGTNNDAGFTGGVQAGYNWQMGSSFVLGVEGDLNYIDRSNGGSVFAPASAGTTVGTYYTVNRGDANNFYGTLRARLGFAFDRALIYATGGLAFGGSNGDASASSTVVTSNGATPPVFTSTTTTIVSNGNNDSNIGWALGGGVEYAFSNAWSVKLEYLHVDLGSKNHTFYAPASPTSFITVNTDNKFDVVRAGVNFRF